MSHIDMVLEQWRLERPDLEVGPMGLTGRLKRIGRHLEREMEKVFAAHDLNLAGFRHRLPDQDPEGFGSPLDLIG